MTSQSSGRPAGRNTKQRRAIEAALSEREDFVTTQQLHRRLLERGDTVSLATAYRVLQTMAETGEVDVLRNDEGEVMYRRCEAEHHHHHLVCRVCGATVELEEPRIESWAERTAREHGYVDSDHTVEITGTCPRCAARGERDHGAHPHGA